MLLVFAGQVLAAPLLACQHSGNMAMSGPVTVDEHGLTCCPMDMTKVSEGMGSMEMPDTQESLGHAVDSTMGCDQPCLQCLCPALTPRQAASALPLPTKQVLAFESFIPPSHLDGLFRPPIFA